MSLHNSRIQQRGNRPMRLFLELWTSRFPADPNFSGIENQETCVRLFINGDGKIDLEIETLLFSVQPPAQVFEHQIFETIEDAVEFLALESNVSNKVYQLVFAELRLRQL